MLSVVRLLLLPGTMEIMQPACAPSSIHSSLLREKELLCACYQLFIAALKPTVLCLRSDLLILWP